MIAPQPVQDTPEVVAARAQHLAAKAAVVAPVAVAAVPPTPVVDTPEVSDQTTSLSTHVPTVD